MSSPDRSLSIHESRRLARHLLDDSSAADAPTAYYALFHPANRSALFPQFDAQGTVTGFAGRFQTGLDLFRPLVTLRCRTPECAADALAEALIPERPYIFFANLNQLPLVGGSLHIENHHILRIYQLNSARFERQINVLVQEKTAADGLPRAEIESSGERAVAGVNWQSPGFAEVYVETSPVVRRRGYGESVVSAVTYAVLSSGRIPIYLVENNNEPSRLLAEKLVYTDTGARQVYADAVYLGHPAHQRQ